MFQACLGNIVLPISQAHFAGRKSETLKFSLVGGWEENGFDAILNSVGVEVWVELDKIFYFIQSDSV